MRNGRSAAPPRLTLLGLFGAGNLGNDSTLHAVTEAILQRIPEAQVQCACADPGAVTERFAIPAYPINRSARAPRTSLLARLLDEAWSFRLALRALWRADALLVCGTNLLSDYLSGPRGWPYDVFKWTVLGRLCGVRVVFLGVGIGPVISPASRWLLGRSLDLAVLRSYRDECSMNWASRMGVTTERDTLSPDVVFGMSTPARLGSVRRTEHRGTIGFGLKNFPENEGGDRPLYRQYIATMATTVTELLDEGYRVRLLVGDIVYDAPVMQDMLDAVRGRCPDGRSAARDPPADHRRVGRADCWHRRGCLAPVPQSRPRG